MKLSPGFVFFYWWMFGANANTDWLFPNLFFLIVPIWPTWLHKKKGLKLVDKYLKRPQNADNTMFFLTLQCAAKNNHNDERSKRAWVHWCRLQPLKPQNVIFRRDHTGIHCCWSFSGWHHWCVHFHLMITKGLVFLFFFFLFFPVRRHNIR